MAAQEPTVYGTITLSHQGKETDYAYNEMIKVMEDATDGDTVYLSTGTFQGDFIMTKRLTFIGAGSEETTYDGEIHINFSKNIKLTSRLFDAIRFDNGIYFESNLDSVRIRKCHLFNKINCTSGIDYMLIDRCYGSLESIKTCPKKLVVRNSLLEGTPNIPSGNIQFYNCNISSSTFYTNSNGRTFVHLLGTFTNCIISTGFYFLENPEKENSTFINCLYAKTDLPIDEGCTIQDCYTAKNVTIDLTKEELEKNNYFGTDGTVVGYYGGKNPYTLLPFSAKTSNSFHLDRDQKQIQFNIKVTEQE